MSKKTNILTKKQIKKILDFMYKYRSLVGFSDWEIQLAIELVPIDNAAAEVTPCILEKIIRVKLTPEFITFPEKQQANILFHELVHGRVIAMQTKMEEFIAIEEEHMVNDLVRGFEMHKKLSW